jgi:uncharacterized membrane protein YhaH (DUF805 family)
MDWTTLLFSFNGRINRGKYWLAVLIYIVVWTAFFVSIIAWLGGLNVDNLWSFAGKGLLIWLGPSFLGSWQTATPDLSGVFILSLAATAIAIWAFVELGCLRGTPGPNQYGPDPLGNPPPPPRR